MPKTGLEPITVSYKETVLPIKLFRLNIGHYPYHYTLFIMLNLWRGSHILGDYSLHSPSFLIIK